MPGTTTKYSDYQAATTWQKDAEAEAARRKRVADAKGEYDKKRKEAKSSTGINGDWQNHAEHPSLDNPQYLLTLPVINSYGGGYADGMGKHKLNIKVTRDGNVNDKGMIVSLFKSFGGKQLLDPADPDLLVAKSEFKPQASATVVAEVVGGMYIIVPALDTAGVKGGFRVTVDTDESEPRLKAFTKQVASVASQWDPSRGRCGGYGKSQNPQFMLSLPEGDHEVLLEMTRTDGATDKGVIFWVFPSNGDMSKLQSVNTGTAMAASKFLKNVKIDATVNMAGGHYLVLCSIQSTDSRAPFELSATIEGRTVPELVEITADGAPAAPAAPAAKLPAAMQEDLKKTKAKIVETKAADACAKSKWTGALSGGYQKVNNPHFVLSVDGAGETTLELERLDGGKEQGMIVFVYSLMAEDDNRYRLRELPKKSTCLAQSKFGQSSLVSVSFPKGAAAKQSFLVLPCLQKAGSEVHFEVRAKSEAKVVIKELTDEVPVTAHSCQGEWTPELSGGYQKVDNPQYLLTVPSSGTVKVAVSRPDGKKDCGMICTMYKGYAGGRLATIVKVDEVAKTGFKVSAGPLEVEWVADAGTYVVVPSLQKKGVCAPFELSVDGASNPTLELINV